MDAAVDEADRMAAPRDMFLLDPEWVYLDHASCGACPRSVFNRYQSWQQQLERQPVELLLRRLTGELHHVRERLACYIGGEAANLALVPNVTYGLNAVLRSVADHGDILTTTHEYGATDNLLHYLARRRGVRVVRTSGVTADQIWSDMTSQIRILVISHITSPTGVAMPVEELARRARDRGVVCVIDGAHAPGHIPIDVTKLDADAYIGACHKWLCGPKAAAFVYAQPRLHQRIDPLVVGWGYEEDAFPLTQDWRSARDPASFLAIPDAIDYVEQHNGFRRARAVLCRAREKLADIGCLPTADDQGLRMCHFRVPEPVNVEQLQRTLLAARIEAPIRQWRDQPLLRISVGDYTTDDDIDYLVEVLTPHLN
jgi:isopenicillin-N epimerase